jgi:phosphoglycerate dehydrogenase-like enzyme
MKVLILHPPEDCDKKILSRHLLPEVEVYFGPEIPQPAEYQLLVAGRPTYEHLSASPVLHTLVIPWAGLPEETRRLMSDFPHLVVHNLHHNAALTSEMALALLLAAAKFVIPFDRSLRQGDWRPRYRPNPSLMMAGRSALVVGYGQIGQRVGTALHSLGVRVLAIRRHPTKLIQPGVPGEIHGPDALIGLLSEVHILVLTLPLTAETKGLIGPNELAALPAGAVLVNVGRGALVEQKSLYQALVDGQLAAAGLDVWYNYPDDEAARENTPPADCPFHKLENVVLSPHRAGHAAETETLRMAHLAKTLNAAASGKPLPNPVNLALGY